MSAVVSAVSDTTDRPDISQDDAVSHLTSLVSRLQGLKRKLEESSRVEHLQAQRCQARLDHLESADTENLSKWSNVRVKRILVDYMLRMSYYDTAMKLAESSNIQDFVDIDVFQEAKKVVEALSNKEVAPALAWSADNKSRLKKFKLSDGIIKVVFLGQVTDEKHQDLNRSFARVLCCEDQKSDHPRAQDQGDRKSFLFVAAVERIFFLLGDVRIVALPFDDSTLAISVGRDVHFFSVDSHLTDKGLKLSFTFSIDESSLVKDIRWRKKSENSYLVLSDSGRLYRRTVDGSVKYVMDNVDAGGFVLRASS